MGGITKLTKAASRGMSLRTTVPMWIVRQFNLSEGDKLFWEIRAEGGELIIIVRPLRGGKSGEENSNK